MSVQAVEVYQRDASGALVPKAGAGSSADTSEKNAAVTVNATTTALITATTKSSRTTLIKNTGTQAVFVGFGANATTAMWPIPVGDTLRTVFTGAINGIVASGTGTVQVLAESK